jgi:hypothetical protein
MKRPLLLVSLALVVTGAGAPAHAAPVTAAGTITIGGRIGGQIKDLSVPRKIKMSPVTASYNSTIAIDLGGSRLAGIVLLSHSDPGFWMVFARQPRSISCAREDAVAEAIPVEVADCPDGDPLIIERPAGDFEDFLVIPQGRYRVVYFTVGGSPKITLRMPGLRGAIAPALTRGVTAKLVETKGGEANRNVFQGGGSHDLQNALGGMIFTSLTSVVSGPNASQGGYCVYGQFPVPTVAYHPACFPIAKSGSGNSSGGASAVRERDHRAALLRGMKGKTDVGWWYSTTGYIHQITATTVWISYTP